MFKRIFKKPQPEQPVKKTKKAKRSFKSARNNRFTQWLYQGFQKISVDTKTDLPKLIIRCRDLCKNNEIMRSHLNNFEKSIIGNKGFKLQSLVKDQNGLIESVNFELEQAWWDFGKRSNGYITKNGQLGDLDLDALILRTLAVDGEVFIHVDLDAKNPYGISFDLIDSLSIDWSKNQQATAYQNAIIAGVEVDKNYKPIRYWLKEGDTWNYQTGKVQSIPAEEIIHIYKHQFVGQVRGFPELCASLESLQQLDDYAIAELFAAKVSACQGIFYERTGSGSAGDWLNQSEQESDEVEDPGIFLSELTPGEASIVPEGYSVKSVSPTHPNTNFGNFCKSIIRRIASAVGVSYNRMTGDYESVNYSSLREAHIAESLTFVTTQRFLLDNWKSIQYELFIKSYLTNTFTKLKPSEYKKYCNYQFICRRQAYFDVSKEIVAIERKLKLGLSNPIIELESQGLDVEEVLDGWTRWKDLLAERNLDFSIEDKLPLNIMQQVSQEEDNLEETE